MQAQAQQAPDLPNFLEFLLGYGVIGLVVILWLTGWLYSRGAIQDKDRQIEKLEEANAKKDEALAKKDETITELSAALADQRAMGETVRRTMEALGTFGEVRELRPPGPQRRGGERR